MENTRSRNWGTILLAAALGALAGGIIAVLVTKVFPKVLSQVMGKMWRDRMVRMTASGGEPPEM